jgi:hypothetical protein
MDEDDEYRRNANYCLYMADSARQASERREWLSLAQSWLRLILRPSDAAIGALDGRATGREASTASH